MIQFARFALVGGSATLLHLATGGALISAGVGPLWSNLIAFVVAFSISFVGHFFYSFRGHGSAAHVVLPRFAAVALSGFALNEGALAALLLVMPSHAFPALCLSTLTAACWTFMSSRFWAFRQRPVAQHRPYCLF